MRRTLPRLLPALLVLAVMVMAGTPAYAQGSALSWLSGLVVDSSGGVIPGATVTIKNKGTGESYEAVTGGNGDFNVPALPPGTYAVTVALMGFKTARNSSPHCSAQTSATSALKPAVWIGLRLCRAVPWR